MARIQNEIRDAILAKMASVTKPKKTTKVEKVVIKEKNKK